MLKSILIFAAALVLEAKAESIVTVYDQLHIYVNDTVNGTLQ